MEDLKVNPLDKLEVLKDDCRVTGIFPPEAIVFEFNEKKLDKGETFAGAQIKDGDTITFDMEIYISDPNIFESVFSREDHEC